ncbi:MAG: helix-turn-helix domain-containing protein [Nitrospirales bacterium]|nr:helix-turn-helix transcriptional regulator [Nitrospira sp.]MDR4501455.1 helix-turn-helix domain-containing protein [Nitrospirales bacterium]
MPINEQIQAWRRMRGNSVTALANKVGMPTAELEAIEAGKLDPPVSALEALATALGIPPGWLYSNPTALKLLLSDPDENENDWTNVDSPDPILQLVAHSTPEQRDMYALLTALLQSEEPKLLRAAEVNLRSLLKQAKTATVPWQNRIPGHFEPPSD